jgi:hypothetical protein
MKSLLSENMLRFGTKNLSATQQKELIVKSIMETIDQHGLRKAIYNRLTEQQTSDFAQDLNARVGSQMKRDGADMKTKGIALKIVGMILKAFQNGNPVGAGTDEWGIVKSIYLIKNQDIYDAVLNLVKTDPKVTKLGRFNTISQWLNTEIAKPRANSFRDYFTSDYNAVYEIEKVLKKYNNSENIEFGTNI